MVQGQERVLLLLNRKWSVVDLFLNFWVLLLSVLYFSVKFFLTFFFFSFFFSSEFFEKNDPLFLLLFSQV